MINLNLNGPQTNFVYRTFDFLVSCQLQRSDKTVSRFLNRRFSLKTNERNGFSAVKSKKAKKNPKKQSCLFGFWENLRCANLLTVLSDLHCSKDIIDFGINLNPG